MTQRSLRYFKTSPVIIRLAVTICIRVLASLGNVEELMRVCGIDVRHETVRFLRHRFGPAFTSQIRKRRVERIRSSCRRWDLDEVFVKFKGERHDLWRAVDHEDEVLESRVAKTRAKKAEVRREIPEAAWPGAGDRNRQVANLSRRLALSRRRRHARGGSLGQQPRRQFTSAIPKAVKDNALLSADPKVADVRLR